MLSNRRLATVLLGMAGVLVVHQLAHGLTQFVGWTGSGVDHGHMAALWATLGPLGAIALAVLAIRQARSFGADGEVSRPVLAALSSGGYLTLEMIEHLGSAHSVIDAVTSPSVLLGLLIAPLVAAVIQRAVTQAATIIDALSAPAERIFRSWSSLSPAPQPVRVRTGDPSQFSHGRRGPPPARFPHHP